MAGLIDFEYFMYSLLSLVTILIILFVLMSFGVNQKTLKYLLIKQLFELKSIERDFKLKSI